MAEWDGAVTSSWGGDDQKAHTWNDDKIQSWDDGGNAGAASTTWDDTPGGTGAGVATGAGDGRGCFNCGQDGYVKSLIKGIWGNVY